MRPIKRTRGTTVGMPEKNLRRYALNVSGMAAVVVLCGTLPLGAHSGHHHPDAMADTGIHAAETHQVADTAAAGRSPATTPDSSGFVGIDEHPGAALPTAARFADRSGDSLTLAECIDGRPTILSFVYFGCRDACGLLLTGLAQVLRTYTDRPESAPNVITISVSGDEHPADAAKAADIAAATLQAPYPDHRWHFLTGSEKNIRSVTDAAGFHFVKKGDDYDHPLAIMILSPQGKITRYITGTDFLPADITLSLMEASNGTVQPTIARVLRSCFSYNPKSHQFTFKTLQVSATVILILIATFVTFLVLASRKRRGKEPRNGA